MHFRNRTAAAITFFLLTLPATAQVSEPPDALFQDTQIIDARIVAPLTTLVRERPKEDYLSGVFHYNESDGAAVEFDVRIRTRGHFRHKTCDFPPLWLNFKKSQTDETLFNKQDKLKLVVHCDDSERYEQTVLREYLAYRILNVITDLSFRARLLRVTYIDSDERRDEQTRFAFLIEHKNRLAHRLDMNDLKIPDTSVDSIQADWLNLTSVFEFFIGNTDFSPIAGPPGDECCHNYVLFGNDVDPLIAIPYDFDQSGFVNAPYAVPNPQFRIRSVRQRVYRGRCVNNEHLAASLQKFRDSRREIDALVDTQEGLDSRVRKSIVRYVDDFYEIIDDPRDVERRIVKKCV